MKFRQAGALADSHFRWYFAARFVNLLGLSMSNIGLAFAVLAVSNDPSSLGVVLASSTVPMIAVLLVGGVIADRFSPIVVLQVCNLAACGIQVALGATVLAGNHSLWVFIALSAPFGLLSGLSYPAISSLVPDLVGDEDLQSANALLSFARSLVLVGGPTIASLVVVGLGPGWAILIDAACWAASSLFLLRVRRELGPSSGRASGASFAANLKAGLGLFLATPWFRTTVVTFGLLNALHMGAWFTLGPLVAKDEIGIGGWGVVLSLESVGVLAGTLVLLKKSLRRPLFAGVIGMSGVGVAMTTLGAAPSLVWVGMAAVCAGVGTAIFGVGWNTAMQESMPRDMLSRAYSYDALFSYAAIPVGQLVMGGLGDTYGAQRILLVTGAAYVLICLGLTVAPSVRSLGRAPMGAPVEQA